MSTTVVCADHVRQKKKSAGFLAAWCRQDRLANSRRPLINIQRAYNSSKGVLNDETKQHAMLKFMHLFPAARVWFEGHPIKPFSLSPNVGGRHFTIIPRQCSRKSLKTSVVSQQAWSMVHSICFRT